MKLILKLIMGFLCLASLSGCTNQTQSKPAKPKITTVKVINQPVSLKKPKQVKPPTRPLPLIFWQKQIHEKKAIYTNSNDILKDNS
ncbi:hypothetical protein [uncultured Lactobacillus sp.]|uniref:hypothetical protein n=1 Tax=uncultured Lactobacillus sp. TaxID=153152 RepID=UPI0028061CDD|nr:hypothetical protein [uncultured Lactobacillus sp.]